MTAPSPAAAGLPAEDVERVAERLHVVGTRPGFAEKPAWERWTELAAAALAEMRPTAAVPDPREGIDWSKHRGSCRVFYAERRCTCGAVPDSRFRDQLAKELSSHGWEAVTRADGSTGYRCRCGHIPADSLAMEPHRANALLPPIAAEVEARVRAALAPVPHDADGGERR